MIRRGAKKYFTNPAFGLLIGILYFTLLATTNNVELSLIVSIISGLLYDVINRFYTNTHLGSFFSTLIIISLIITLIFSYILQGYNLPKITYVVLFEMLMVIFLILTRLSRDYLDLLLGKEERTVEKSLLGEFIETTRLVEYVFTVHVFTVLIYNLLNRASIASRDFSFFLYNTAPILLLLAVTLYQILKTNSIVRKLRKEDWLPIVSESGEVRGKVAQSVSVQMGNKYLHPVIRLVFIHNDRLYLQKRSKDSLYDIGSFDHPIEKHLLYDKEIGQAVEESLAGVFGSKSFDPHFLLKYVFENEEIKRLVFLYTVRVNTAEQLDLMKVFRGKFWTKEQIEKEFEFDDFFSEYFQLEYEYLKNTVLTTESLRKESL